MAAPRFTLVLVSAADGFIARARGEPPSAWASAEEQAQFLARVERFDWTFMGRGTHEAAPRPDRRRVVFSTAAEGGMAWRAVNHLWVDPARAALDDVLAELETVRPPRDLGILGGSRVHDWFHGRGLIDQVALSIEPVRFGAGLPIFTDQTERDPLETFVSRGYAVRAASRLNDAGTVFVRLESEAAQP